MDKHTIIIWEDHGGYYGVIDPESRNRNIDLFNYDNPELLCKEIPKTIELIEDEIDDGLTLPR